MDHLQTCREHAHKFYCDLLLAAEKTLIDTLFEHAEQSNNNEDQNRFYEGMQQIKSHSNNMHTAFKNQLQASFESFANSLDEELNVDQKIDINNLSLVQRDELEDELAISVIVSKSNSRNAETLWKLNHRLAVLRGGKKVSDENNPFGPASVCAAIKAGVNELALESKIKIIIYKQLGKLFVISFSKELDALNEMLIAKKILPNLRFSLTQSATANSATTSSNNPANSDETDTISQAGIEPTASIAHQHELYNAIRNLQSEIGVRTQTAGGVDFAGVAIDGRGGEESFSAMDYAFALSSIQQSRALLSSAALTKPLAAELVEEKLFNQLAEQGNTDGRHKMTPDDADTVDLVGMIFRYMLDDPNLHDAVKSLLSHLHTPYLKLALMDKSFLDNYQHSARVLLNTMAEVGGKWVKEDSDRSVLPKIKMIVESVLNGFIDEPSIFDQLLEDFSRFRETLEKRARMIEQRNTESEQGLEKLELSKLQATDEINSRLEKANIPNNIADLLRKPWTDFLAFNLLRHGAESLTWHSALKVADGVIWSVGPKAIADNITDFKRHQTELDHSVATGLTTIGYDPDASKDLLAAMKAAQELAYHNAIMEEPPAADVTITAPTTKTTIDESNPEQTSAAKLATGDKPKTKTADKITSLPLSKEEQTIVEKLKEIAFGTWFEFDREDTIKQLKLAWFSRVTLHYMFVDQTGVKQAVENQHQLAKEMCAGNIRIIEPSKKSFMERALEAVFDKLKFGR